MATRANALGGYLRARHQQVWPEDVGLISGARRRSRLCAAAERARRSTDRFPKAGEGRCAASRVLQHPPVPQPVEHFRVGSGSFGRSTPDRL
jgi:hypothetical protein